MIPTTWSEDEIRAFLASPDSANTSYFVEAGAGAGKTYLIVERIVEQLCSGAYTLDEIVAITFTVKSTRELQSRLDQRFLSLCQECQKNGNTALLEKATYFRKNLGKMQISTIHSFCNTLLNTMPFHAGLDGPITETLEEAEYRSLIQEFYKRIQKENPAHFDTLLAYSIELKDTEDFFRKICFHSDKEVATLPPSGRDGLENQLFPICSQIRTVLQDLFFRGIVPDSPDRLPPVVGSEDESMVHPAFLDFLKQPNPDREETILAFSLLHNLYHKPLDSNATGVSELKQYLKMKKDDLPSGVADGVMYQTMVALNNYVKDSKSDPLSTTVKYQAYCPLLEELIHSHLVEALLPLREGFLAEKEASDYTTKDDLLSLTRDMLGNSPEAREYFHQRYRVLYVDEFQDTDPVQTELLFFLTAELDKEEPLPGDWRLCKPRPGSLFLVGDPKQSIYRFRGADIANYKAVGKLFDDGLGDTVTLHYNFRSQQEICDFVETCFHFQPDPTAKKPPVPEDFLVSSPYQAEYVQMKPKQAQVGGKIMPYRTHNDTKGPEPTFVSFLIESLVAGHMDYKEMQNHIEAAGANVQVNGMKNLKNIPPSATTPPRKYQYSDFLILCLNKKDVEEYVGVLARRNIPTLSSGEVQLMDAKPIVRGLAHLKVLAYPDNSAALGHLLFQHYQVSLPTIQRFLQLSRGPLWQSLIYEETRTEVLSLLTDEEQDQAVARLCVIGETLSMLAKTGKYMPPMAVVEWIFDGPCQVWDSVDPQRKEVEYSRVQQFLNALRQKAKGNLTDYYLSAQEIGETAVEYQLALKEAGNCVRVMNLHKSKGLEAPVVFLPCNSDASHKVDSHIVRNGKKSILYQRCASRFLQLGIPPGWTTPDTGWDAIEQQYIQGEKVRLNYVAATRAADMLYLFGGMKSNRWSHLYDRTDRKVHLASKKLGGAAFQEGYFDFTMPKKPPLLPVNMAVTEQSLEGMSQSVLASHRLHISPSKLDKHAPRSSKSETPEGTEEPAPLIQEKHQPYGAGWGTIVHRVMELSLRHQATEPSALHQFALQGIYESFPTETLTATQSHFFFGEPAVSLTQEKRQLLGDCVVEALDFLQNPKDPYLALLQQGKPYPEMSFFTSAQAQTSLYDHLHQHLQGQAPEAFDVEGFIDLAIDSPDGWIVVDYKTDKLLPSESEEDYETRLKSHYHSQIAAYALLLEKATGKKVVGTYLCSIPLKGKLISLL